jgi:hypothetical protein
VLLDRDDKQDGDAVMVQAEARPHSAHSATNGLLAPNTGRGFAVALPPTAYPHSCRGLWDDCAPQERPRKGSITAPRQGQPAELNQRRAAPPVSGVEARVEVARVARPVT